jgi:amino acid adenylation domain-containing protein
MTTASARVDETLSRGSRTGQRLRVRPTNSFVEFKRDEINQSIPARFEQQVNKYPHRVAVKTVSVHFTYLELNQFANRIARAILARSGCSAEPVALLMQQGAPLIAAILGVLKAGKFYVPLDSSFAEVRLAAMVEHSRPGLILTDHKNLAAAGKLSNGALPVLTLDGIGAGFSSDDLDLAVSPEAIAYILYTSGSTGKPKGVFQCHRNALHAVMKYTNGAHLCAADRLTLLMSSSFGASISDIFGALLNGAGLFPFNLKEEGLLHLSDWLNNEEITVYHSVPTVFRHFVATLKGTEQFPKLRLVKLGGEGVHRKDFEKFKRYFPPNCLFHVGFGATEINSVCQYFCDHQSTFEGITAPVGYVMDDTEILLLDGSGREVRPGGTGEIAIRSKYLALGYWRQPELTKKAFRSDSKDGGERIYCTGDLGRMLPDGCLVHLGRKDFQLKIRGHRVEAAEVEMALRENPSVEEAVVVGRNVRNGETQLVAYIVTRGTSSPSISDLRNSLKQSLSDYMMPSAFVVLDALPLTENGKLDRNALPAPAQERPNLGTVFMAPRDTVESEMSHIWSGILGIEPIGVIDNFFSLGGDSLSAVQLVSQVSCSFQVELAMHALIESPTIAALAEKVQMLKYRSHAMSEAPWTSLVSIQAGDSRRPFFLIPGGLGSDSELLIYARMAHYLGREYPCYGFRARASDRRQRPHTSTEEMATDYIREIRAIQPKGPYLLVGECVGGIVAYEMAQQLLAQGQQVALLALLDTPRPTRARQLQFWWRRLRERFFVSRESLLQRIIRHWRQPTVRGLGERIGYLFGKSRNFAQKFAFASYLKQTPPKNEELQEMWHDEVRRTGYVRTLFRYRPKRYTGRITMLVNEVDAQRNPDFGWRGLAVGGLTIYRVPGDHLSYIRDHAKDAAEGLRDCLEEATRER